MQSQPQQVASVLSKGVNLFQTNGKVARQERVLRNGHPGCIIWLTGLSAAGKTTIAEELERQLFDLERQVYLLDGDKVRLGLCSDLGFSHEDRTENIRRVGEVARLFADAGAIVIAAFISPYRADRALVRNLMPKGEFIEVFVNAPLAVCERRDPKGLYARARSGAIPEFTGVSAPYETPENPEIELRTDEINLEQCVARIVEHLEENA